MSIPPWVTCAVSNPLESLAASADAARDILERAADGPTFTFWGSVVSRYRRAKQPLIDALDPATGRRVVPYTHEPTPGECWRQWREALQFRALDSTPDSTDRTRQRRVLLIRHGVAADGFARAMTEADAMGQVMPASPLCALPGIRPGARLTRALSAYLRTQGATADEASVLTDAYSAAAQATQRTGHIVLSANILDILICSENCSYSSCHALDGAYRAGPLCYLADPHALAVYYYEREEQWNGCALPHKRFRQMVYVDAKRQSASLQRHYGGGLPTAAHKTIRREIARLLTAIATGAPCDGEPHWYKITGAKGLQINQGGTHAYVDATVEMLQLRSGGGYRPVIRLAAGSCPSCGDALDKADSLVCEGCADAEEREVCCSCGDEVGEDDSHSEEDGVYCDSCWSEEFTSCNRCGETITNDGDDCNHLEGYGDYCDRCYSRITSDCAGCEERYHDNDLTDGYCSDCLDACPECDDCGGRHHESETGDVDGDALCGDCAADRGRYAPLYQRLLASPRFRRSMDGMRGTLARVWELRVSGSTGWDWCYFAALEMHGTEVRS